MPSTQWTKAEKEALKFLYAQTKHSGKGDMTMKQLVEQMNTLGPKTIASREYTIGRVMGKIKDMKMRKELPESLDPERRDKRVRSLAKRPHPSEAMQREGNHKRCGADQHTLNRQMTPTRPLHPETNNTMADAGTQGTGHNGFASAERNQEEMFRGRR